MKHTVLLLMFLGLLTSASAQDSENAVWNNYLKGIRIDDIADAGDYLWLISDFNTKLRKFDKKSGNVVNYDYKDFNIEPDDWLIDVECDNNGIPWVGTFVGTFKMSHDNTWTLIHHGSTFAMTKSKDGVVWIAYRNEIIRYEGDSIKVLDGNEVSYASSIATDRNGDLWSIRNNPLASFFLGLSNYDGYNWNRMTPPFVLVYVSNLNIDKNDTKWMSAYGGEPLISYDEITWKRYDTPFQTTINSIATENENIWCGTKNGLMRFTNSQWKVYNVQNSELPSDTVYQISVDADGTKWIGTQKGLVAFDLTTSVSTISKLNHEFELYPNPAHDYLNLKVPKELQSSKVDIMSASGQVLQSFNLNNNQKLLQISQLPAGVYLLRIQSKENQSLEKFVKQ